MSTKYEEALQKIEFLNYKIANCKNDKEAVDLQQQLIELMLEYVNDPELSLYLAQKSMENSKK